MPIASESLDPNPWLIALVLCLIGASSHYCLIQPAYLLLEPLACWQPPTCPNIYYHFLYW